MKNAVKIVIFIHLVLFVGRKCDICPFIVQHLNSKLQNMIAEVARIGPLKAWNQIIKSEQTNCSDLKILVERLAGKQIAIR